MPAAFDERVVALVSQVDDIKTRLRGEQQKRRRLETRVDSLEHHNVELQSQLDLVQLDRQKGEHLRPRLGFNWALRRNLGHTSLRQLSLLSTGPLSTSDTSLHRHTLRRKEVEACSCLISEARQFFAENGCELMNPGNGLRCSFTRTRCDATNKAGDHKWHSIEVDSFYVYNMDSAAPETAALTIWPEVLPVDSGCPINTWRLIHRQLNSVGCPVFEADYRLDDTDGPVLRTHTHTTDGGSDQIVVRQWLTFFVKDRPFSVFCSSDCFQHHVSNAVKTSLKRSDEISDAWGLSHKVFSTLVKGTNHYRCGHFTITRYWKRHHPDTAHFTATLPSKPCSTRWGTTDGCEKWHLAPPPGDLIDSMKRVKATPLTGKRAGPLDETQVDDSLHFQQKKGRWATECFAVACFKAYWILLRIQHACRQPWHHFYLFLQKKSDTKLADIVCGDASRIGKDFDTLLDGTWEWVFDNLEGVLDGTWVPDKDHVFHAVVTFVLSNGADYWRRVTNPTNTMPMLFLCMGHLPKHVPCDFRARVARLCIECYGRLHDEAKKLINFFMSDLRDCIAAEGAVSKRLWLYGRYLAFCWKPDTQAVESFQKVITDQHKRCSGVRDELVSARGMIKKSLFSCAEGVTGDTDSAAVKSATLKRLAELTDVCADLYATPMYMDVAMDKSRRATTTGFPKPGEGGYSGPTAIPLLDAPAAAAAPPAAAAAAAAAAPRGPTQKDVKVSIDDWTNDFDADDMDWSYKWNLDWYRRWESKCARHCFFFHKSSRPKLAVGSEVWLCANTFFFSGLCAKALAATTTEIHLVHPLCFMDSQRVIAAQRSLCPIAMSRLTCHWLSPRRARVSGRRSMLSIQEVHPKDIKPARMPRTPRPAKVQKTNGASDVGGAAAGDAAPAAAGAVDEVHPAEEDLAPAVAAGLLAGPYSHSALGTQVPAHVNN